MGCGASSSLGCVMYGMGGIWWMDVHAYRCNGSIRRLTKERAHNINDVWNTHRYGDLKGTKTLWECAQATGTHSN